MSREIWRLTENERHRINMELRNRGRHTVQLTRKKIRDEKITDEIAKKTLRKCASTWNELAQSWLLPLTVKLIGGSTSAAKRLSTGLILLGGGLDLHDDIIDKTLKKQGTKTCLNVYGLDRTLLAGDYLIVKGLASFSKAALALFTKRLAIRVIEILENAMIEMMDAESIEIGFRRNLDTTPHEYLDMVVKKSADIEAYFRIGAILGHADSKIENSISQFGRAVGTLVILRDDISDMIDPTLAKNRLSNESYPLPILLALQNSLINPKVIRILKKPSYSKEDCQLLFELVYHGGVLNEVEDTMMRFMKKAIAHLSQIKACDTLETILKSVFPPFHLLNS